MTGLLVFREYIQKLYRNHDTVFRLLFRFMIGFITFFSINRMLGYQTELTPLPVSVVMGAFSMLFSVEALLFFAAAFVVIHIFNVSTVLAVSVAIILLIVYLLYIQFAPKYGYVILLVTVAYSLGLSSGVPVLLGLIAEPVILLPGVIGVGLYYFLNTLLSVVSSSTDDTLNLFQLLVDQFLGNTEMVTQVVILLCVTVLVYAIRNLKVNYSFESAIAIGFVCYTILCLLANYYQLMRIPMGMFLVKTLIAFVIVSVIQIFRLSLNYAGVENLQFEDEEYYYYVRAVPKNSIATRDKSVKRFNAHLFSDRVTYLKEDELQKVQEAITGEGEEKEDSWSK